MSPDRRGILLAGGAGTRLHPMTLPVSKQLMPVFDKPLLYYPLSVLMLAGIREVCVITAPESVEQFRSLLGDGARWGLRFEYVVQDKPEGIAQALTLAETFLEGHPSALALGDNLFYGDGLAKRLREASASSTGATIFATRVTNPTDYGVLDLGPELEVVDIVEKPKVAPSPWAVTGLYFYDHEAPEIARSLKPSARGELEITDLNRAYLRRGQLDVVRFGRGYAWLDTGTPESLLRAANFVQSVQTRQGLQIACPEEIAYRQGWIGRDDLWRLAGGLRKTTYGKYLLALLEDEEALPEGARLTEEAG